MKLEVGQVYQTKSGEIMEIIRLDEKKFEAQLYHPKTKVKTELVLSGDAIKLPMFLKIQKAKLISL